MKILVIGKGYIGERLSYFLSKAEGFEVHTVNQGILDYHNPDTFRMFLGYHSNTINAPFDRIIICAGFTGQPNVDECEKPDMKPVAYYFNVELPVKIVNIAAEFGIRTIHIGSGCIYDGYKKMFTENDEPNFGMFSNESSFYSKTKHICESVIKNNSHVFRIRMPYTFIPGNKNYFTKILGYPTTFSKENSVTSVDDFYNFIYNFILADSNYSINFGVFNVTNTGYITAKEIADLMKEVGIKDAIEKNWNFTDNLETLGVTAKRSNCVLDTTKITELGLALPSVKDSIVNSLRLYKEFIEKGSIDQAKSADEVSV